MRIVLADDHEMFRQGLTSLLESEGFQVVGDASNGQQAVHLCRELRPDAAVLDLSMSIFNGIEAAREIRNCSPNTRSVLLTMFEEDAYVLEALHAGVRGYVLKAQAPSDLAEALREVSHNRLYLSPEVAGAVVDAYLRKEEPSRDPLTPKERQVLQLVAEGNRTKGIARALGMAVKTAESHRNRIMRKLEVRNTAGMVRYAVRHGLVQP